ncbi:MAG: hypothetical protein H0X03_07735 [Nitrosopumilus sp.]|nr:hypothetical protein [Nitrosopumilus sp.]
MILLCNSTKNPSDEFISYLNTRFEGYPVRKGDQFVFNFLGTTLEFNIHNTLPKEVVQINKNTRITIKPAIENFVKKIIKLLINR